MQVGWWEEIHLCWEYLSEVIYISLYFYFLEPKGCSLELTLQMTYWILLSDLYIDPVCTLLDTTMILIEFQYVGFIYLCAPMLYGSHDFSQHSLKYIWCNTWPIGLLQCFVPLECLENTVEVNLSTNNWLIFQCCHYMQQQLEIQGNDSNFRSCVQ